MPYKTRRCNARTAAGHGEHLARCSWANHVRRRILPFLAIDRIKFTIQARIGAVKLSDPVASPFHADLPPVALYSVPRFRNACINMHVHKCPCVNPGTLVCGIGVKFDFKPAEIAYRKPTPMPRGTFTAGVGVNKHRPAHSCPKICIRCGTHPGNI